MASGTRKIHMVCISDTHNCGGAFKLPKGDVLIHAGDLTNQGSYAELLKANLLQNAPSIQWLRHESAVIKLKSLSGSRTISKIFGSPYSPAKVTHTLSKNHCDENKYREAAGCEILREMLWQVRPRLHVSVSRGVRVTWDLVSSNCAFKELFTDVWDDPRRANNRISIVDLTAKGGCQLRNDGAVNVDGPRCNVLNSLPSVRASGKLGLGLGKEGLSSRCDQEALFGRLSRQETCMVNVAIMQSSWPHKIAGGKAFNKPIVVDIDIPA
ncbi:hypothetical protein BJ878DRAFT_583518 [Calycina marina]|uniref:Calcineurin-like phosphoesterase domain-containing protein n=1 Tax=Calycina marina TaxID=1763456 RepID=A0A9P7Z0D7_9HELO|nr:hypothetical protein BJ878DRAFT_583518 [Calycina marina]